MYKIKNKIQILLLLYIYTHVCIYTYMRSLLYNLKCPSLNISIRGSRCYATRFILTLRRLDSLSDNWTVGGFICGWLTICVKCLFVYIHNETHTHTHMYKYTYCLKWDEKVSYHQVFFLFVHQGVKSLERRAFIFYSAYNICQKQDTCSKYILLHAHIQTFYLLSSYLCMC